MFKITDKYFFWGIVIVVVSYVINLNPFTWIFGTPLIFIGGVILVWSSGKNKTTKILATILPVLLWYPGIMALIYFGTNHATPSTFLIPKNFRGKIIIYYGEPCGQKLYKTNGRYIYNIPKNGIMILKDQLEDGFIDEEYFFVNEQGEKIKKIAQLDQRDFNEDYTIEKNKHEPPRNKISVFLGGTGGGMMANEKEFKYQEMYVMSWDSLRVFKNDNDSLAYSLLKSCRVKK